jgi:electron transport complex protein RnfG
MTKTEARPLTLVLAVAITCIVAASGLSVTYAVTKDRIADQDRKAQEDSLKSALPDAASFEEVTDAQILADAWSAAGDVQVNGIFSALDGDGRPVGWGLRLGSRGYGGYAQLVIGLDSSGSVTGVSVLSHGETPGLGTKVMGNPEYLGLFETLESGFTSRDVRAIDSIAGATKSSRAVQHAVDAAGTIYADVLPKGGE